MEKEFNFIEPELIKAGDDRLKLGQLGLSPKADCRVISEENYQYLLSFKKDPIKSEYTAGEIVDMRINGWPEDIWRERKLLCKNSFGKFVGESKDGNVECYDHIRKHNPDRVYQEIAERILNEGPYISIPGSNGKGRYILSEDVKQMLITAAKEGEKLKK